MWCDIQPTLFLFPIVSFLTFGKADSAPVSADNDATSYLQQFGYLPESDWDFGRGASRTISKDSIKEALKDFQSFAGLEQTGVLDHATREMMKKPRCGVKDIIEVSQPARRKRYTHQGSKWKTTRLTYRIRKYPSNIRDRQRVDAEVARAFKVWSDVTKLVLVERKRGRVNIEVRFEAGEHGDDKPFDGEGKMLAHAFPPESGGDAHFDDDEKWTIDGESGPNLFQIAAHEFGHSLGLGHSTEPKSVMAPYDQGYEPAFELHTDDIIAIQALYGRGAQRDISANPRVSSESPSPTSVANGLSNDTDAAF